MEKKRPTITDEDIVNLRDYAAEQAIRLSELLGGDELGSPGAGDREPLDPRPRSDAGGAALPLPETQE